MYISRMFGLTLVMAKWGGVPTFSKVELFVQNTYFLFQVFSFSDSLLISGHSSIPRHRCRLLRLLRRH